MKFTPNALATLAGGTVEGDGEILLTGFGKIEEAGAGCVSFIANPKYEHFIHTTKADAVIVSNEFMPGVKVRPVLIRVADPYAALAELMSYMQKTMAQNPKGIEAQSHIDDTARIGENVYIGAFAYIGANSVIEDDASVYPQSFVGANAVVGKGSVIYPGVKIYPNCVIGKNCIIHSGAVIGADGFGFAPKNGEYEKIPQIGNVVIEDNVEIGANTCVDRATFGSTVIGHGTKLDNLIQIAHNVEVGHDNVIASQTGVAGSTKIGNNNRCGGQVGFAGHITIGDNNEFGAQSGIPNNVGSGKRLIGYPATDARAWAKAQVYIKKLEELFNK